MGPHQVASDHGAKHTPLAIENQRSLLVTIEQLVPIIFGNSKSAVVNVLKS
jgi:hypothetical protein